MRKLPCVARSIANRSKRPSDGDCAEAMRSPWLIFDDAAQGSARIMRRCKKCGEDGGVIIDLQRHAIRGGRRSPATFFRLRVGSDSKVPAKVLTSSSLSSFGAAALGKLRGSGLTVTGCVRVWPSTVSRTVYSPGCKLRPHARHAPAQPRVALALRPDGRRPRSAAACCGQSLSHVRDVEREAVHAGAAEGGGEGSTQ